MRRTFAGLAVTLLLSTTIAAAQGSYSLTRHVVGGGGGRASGGAYALESTLGQPVAGPLSGGTYSLNAGFWSAPGAPSQGYRVYLPLILHRYRGG